MGLASLIGLTGPGAGAAWAADGPASQSFAYTGEVQIFTVPDHVATLHVVATGANGGRSPVFGTPGGGGGTVAADLAVSAAGPIHAGDRLVVVVGGHARDASGGYPGALGGYNGGGNSDTGLEGGAGGGASDVRLAPGTLQDRLVVAAGGGGGASSVGGGPGQAGGGAWWALGGRPGTATAGGEGFGWDGDQQQAAAQGSFGRGGDGGACPSAMGFVPSQGGAGGGGWYGGGGGAPVGDCSGLAGDGGGGGSDYTAPFATNVSSSTEAVTVPQVTISWTVDSLAPVIVSQADVSATAAAGTTSATVTYPTPTARDAVDGTVPVSCSPASGSTFNVGTTAVDCTATDAAGNTGTSRFSVVVATAPAPVDKADLRVSVSGPTTAKKGATVTYTVIVTNNGPAAAAKLETVLAATGLGVTRTAPVATTGTIKVGATTLAGSRWSTATLATGASATYTVTGTVTASSGRTVGIVAGGISVTPDPAISTNLSTTTTKVG